MWPGFCTENSNLKGLELGSRVEGFRVEGLGLRVEGVKFEASSCIGYLGVSRQKGAWWSPETEGGAWRQTSTLINTSLEKLKAKMFI